jgi:thiol-disulfide isomerase/thioredoxin
VSFRGEATLDRTTTITPVGGGGETLFILERRVMRVTLPMLCLGVIAASCLASAASNLPPLRAQRWVNPPLLTTEDLRGKVVLVDFWEYTCVNWIRTAPYIKAWNRDYAPLGLVIVGVHAPIAIDNDFTIWREFGNDAWPAKYLFDNRGRLVRRWVGEGSYDEIEKEIRRLLAPAESGSQLPAMTELASTFAKVGQQSYAAITNETDVGAERRESGAVSLKATGTPTANTSNSRKTTARSSCLLRLER